VRDLLDKDKYWDSLNPNVIMCSPLIRAQKTALGLLTREQDILSVKYLESLRETTPFETIVASTVNKRIKTFETHLLTSTTMDDRIVVIGHSQYFRKMLNLPGLMRNCDVVRATANFDDEGKCIWSDVSLLYRSTLSNPNPIQIEKDITSTI
jgi:hypothetical protein